MMDVWSGLAGGLPGYCDLGRQGAAMRSRVRSWSVGHLVVVPCRFVVGVGGGYGGRMQVQVQGAGLNSGSGWRGRLLKEKADGVDGDGWTECIECIKWQTDETQQELGR